ncbi:MAG: hypothetical protein AB7U81_12545 [Thiohalomonadaceae bacterium]
MSLMIGFLLPLLPWVVLWVVLRHGPFRNRWWKGENPIGFALCVGGLAFLVGFIGPMILAPGANQGPLLGILITGPWGLVVGAAWGLLRAALRGRWNSLTE